MVTAVRVQAHAHAEARAQALISHAHAYTSMASSRHNSGSISLQMGGGLQQLQPSLLRHSNPGQQQESVMHQGSTMQQGLTMEAVAAAAQLHSNSAVEQLSFSTAQQLQGIGLPGSAVAAQAGSLAHAMSIQQSSNSQQAPSAAPAASSTISQTMLVRCLPPPRTQRFSSVY